MSTQDWAQLVQRVDLLINALRAAKSEAKKWRSRAAELERLNLPEERNAHMQEQAKSRELERLQRERKKVISTIVKIIHELEQSQIQIMEHSNHE